MSSQDDIPDGIDFNESRMPGNGAAETLPRQSKITANWDMVEKRAMSSRRDHCEAKPGKQSCRADTDIHLECRMQLGDAHKVDRRGFRLRAGSVFG